MTEVRYFKKDTRGFPRYGDGETKLYVSDPHGIVVKGFTFTKYGFNAILDVLPPFRWELQKYGHTGREPLYYPPEWGGEETTENLERVRIKNFFFNVKHPTIRVEIPEKFRSGKELKNLIVISLEGRFEKALQTWSAFLLRLKEAGLDWARKNNCEDLIPRRERKPVYYDILPDKFYNVLSEKNEMLKLSEVRGMNKYRLKAKLLEAEGYSIGEVPEFPHRKYIAIAEISEVKESGDCSLIS